jgi:tetratricopeptide (TPR) repeat protein
LDDSYNGEVRMLKRLFIAPPLFAILLAAGTVADNSALERARDHQDRAAIDQAIAKLQQEGATKPDANYRLALANSYAAEIAIEQRDKRKAEHYAEAGIDAAKKAVAASPNVSEYHRLLGELCGQVIPASPLLGAMKYGQCARDEVNKAIELDPKSPLNYVSRGVGNYYLPAQFGGGVDLALKDFDKAIALNPNLTEAYLWKGIALRKAGRNAEARVALEKAIQLSPERSWAKEQLQKTPER